MENSLSPAFVKINYQSRFAPHTMTIPSVPLIAAVGDAAPYFDLRGLEIDVNVDTAIRDFVTVIKPFFRTDTNFVDYTVFSQPGVGDIPEPVWSASLNILGTSAISATPDKARQQTRSYRATDFTPFRLVFLDAPFAGNGDKITNVDDSPADVALNDYVTALATWIASRGGGRPKTFLSVTYTINEKLRRSYRMT